MEGLTEVPAAVWVGVIGTLAGVIVGGALSYFTELFSWRRRRKDRWDERRLHVYSTFLAAVLTAHKNWMFRPGPESVGSLRATVTTDLEQVTSAVAEVNLVSSGPVREAAHRLLDALEDLVNQVLDYRVNRPRGVWSGFNEPALQPALRVFMARRAEFEERSQEELDIQ